MTASSTYLLRVRLPDQPGVLGKVASALGSTGADIDSIVVVDRTPGYAVDDLVVSLPAGALADKLVSAASSVPGVIVEMVQRHHGRQRMQDELALLDEAASSADPLAVLAAGLPELVHANYALVIEAGDDGNGIALAASMSAPDQRCRARWLPLDAPREIKASEVWDDPELAGPDCELVAVPFRQTAALLVGRIGGPGFRPTELTRLSHLARVAHALLAGP
jgi:hypothetical protein